MPTLARQPAAPAARGTLLAGRVRAAAPARVARALDALLAHAQPSAEAAEALTATGPSALPRIANTIPPPGLVIGVLLAFGIDASAAVPAVLAYRAIALWLPATLGTAAVVGLRCTTARGAEHPVLGAA